MVGAESAAECFADVGRAEGRGEVEDGTQEEGGRVRGDAVGTIRAVGEGSGYGWLVGDGTVGGRGEWRLEGVLGNEGWAGEAMFVSFE